MNRRFGALALVGYVAIAVAFFPSAGHALTDTGEIPADKAVWSNWYWPFHDDYNPNLYDANEALARYDTFDAGATSQLWEYNNHGPTQHPAPWWGHCHGWAAAACWEEQPTEEQVLDDVTFRIRDRKGLMTEMYDHSADGIYYELYVDLPSPGLFWRYLREEVRGDNALHGHGMPFIGELAYGPQVWNYPIYKYEVEFSESVPHSGTITIWVADDGEPGYADLTTLYAGTFTYQFKGVRGDGTNPIDSGTWLGSGAYHRPDAIWRPYPALTWTQYAGNPEIDEAHINAILSEKTEEPEIQSSQETIEVPGNTLWLNSGMHVAVGETMTFTARGTIVFDNNGYACGPGGTFWTDTRDQQDALWQQPHGGLIGKIGEDGAPFFIGDSYTVKSWNKGSLFLGINDYWYQGNSGKFTVTIRLSGGSGEVSGTASETSTIYIENLRFPDAGKAE